MVNILLKFILFESENNSVKINDYTAVCNESLEQNQGDREFCRMLKTVFWKEDESNCFELIR